MKKILLLAVFLFSSAFSAYALEEVYYGLKKTITLKEQYVTCWDNSIFSPDDKHLIQTWKVWNGDTTRGYVYIYDLETFDIVGVYDDMKALFFRDSLLFLHRYLYMEYGDSLKPLPPTTILRYPDYEVVKEWSFIPDNVTSLINGKRYVSRALNIWDYETEKLVKQFPETQAHVVWLNVYSSKVYEEFYWSESEDNHRIGQSIDDFLDSSFTWTKIGIDREPFNSANRGWTGKERLKIPKAQYQIWSQSNNIGNKPIRYIDFKNGEDFTDSIDFRPIMNQMDENMNYKYWMCYGTPYKSPYKFDSVVYTYWNQVWIPTKILHLSPLLLKFTEPVFSNSGNIVVMQYPFHTNPSIYIYEIDSVVSVGDSVQADKPLVVYSNGELRITPPSNNYSVIISDLAGAVILERQFTNALDALIANVSGWTRGMYLINITDAKGNSYPYKFVQEK